MVISPNVFEDLGPGQNAPLIPYKVFEYREFFWS
jgi:hypothetical protein